MAPKTKAEDTKKKEAPVTDAEQSAEENASLSIADEISLLKEATEEANKAIEAANKAKKEAEKVITKAKKVAQEANPSGKPAVIEPERKYTLTLFKGKGELSEDLIVGVNGRMTQIKRGIPVEVPESVYLIVENKHRQEMIAADLVEEAIKREQEPK